MTKLTSEKQSLLPIAVMIVFTVLLIASLLFKVYQADRDLGQLRSEKYQARLAAESGINYTITKMCEAIRLSDRPVDPEVLTSMFFEDSISIDKWISFGVKTKSFFRVSSIRKLYIDDNEKTTLVDEGQQYQIIVEGKCGRHIYSTAAIVQLYDLAKIFGVFQSLDEYYYGNPLLPYIFAYGSFKDFYSANLKFFESGIITNQGKILDPNFLVKMYEPNGKAPFATPDVENKVSVNYGSYYSRNGISPCNGAVYCSTPVVIDNHTFNAPAQTALYFYRRPGTRPVLKSMNLERNMNSSPRVQHTSGNIEERNLTKYFVDKDSVKYSSFIPSWKPDIDHIRELCKNRGIYIDSEGKGFLNGQEIDIDYHAGFTNLFSDTYLKSNSSAYEQDELIDEKYIVLSSDTKFSGYNNISSQNLNGARILFSERSIFIRGEIGSDLVIATPGHIFLTGPTNIASNLNLFLIAAQGTAVSTSDLEDVIKSKNSSQNFIEAVREWKIKAIIYKPGAGFYSNASNASAGVNSTNINFRGVAGGRSLKLHIVGSCIGGNLQRWIDNTETNSLVIDHNPNCAQRLAISPVTANVLRLRTRPVKYN